MERIIKWLLFGVLCSLLPIGFVALDFFTDGTGFNMANLIGKGELLLVSSGIAAAGLGELLTESPKKSVGVMFTGASSIILIGVCSYWFSSVASSASPNLENIANGSLWVFGVSVVTTIICFRQTEAPAWKI